MVEDHLGNQFPDIKSMCKYWNIKQSTYSYRINNGSSIEKALTAHVSIQDHLGNKFPSIAKMCEYWGIDTATYKCRIKRGQSMRTALENKPDKIVYDHLGQAYLNKRLMCKHWNINYRTFSKRISNKWSLEDALTRHVENTIKDHKGNSFSSITAMCEYWNIKYSTYRNRIQSGKSIEAALSNQKSKGDNGKRNQNISDHTGRIFKSAKAMCAYWHVTYATYAYRLQQGWTVEKALTTKPVHTKITGVSPCEKSRCETKTIYDHEGHAFKTIREMCKYWGISYATYNRRCNANVPLENILATDSSKIIKDHLGQIFPNIAAMCQHWHVSKSTYHDRIASHCSIEEALGVIPVLFRLKHEWSYDDDLKIIKQINDADRTYFDGILFNKSVLLTAQDVIAYCRNHAKPDPYKIDNKEGDKNAVE